MGDDLLIEKQRDELDFYLEPMRLERIYFVATGFGLIDIPLISSAGFFLVHFSRAHSAQMKHEVFPH